MKDIIIVSYFNVLVVTVRSTVASLAKWLYISRE